MDVPAQSVARNIGDDARCHPSCEPDRPLPRVDDLGSVEHAPCLAYCGVVRAPSRLEERLAHVQWCRDGCCDRTGHSSGCDVREGRVGV